MKKTMTQILPKHWLLLVFLFPAAYAAAQSSTDNAAVKRAAMDYIEGFYEGDTLKLQRCLSPNLYKYGYWKEKSGYAGSRMTYAQAIDYAKSVLAEKQFPKKDAPKTVAVLDVQAQVACAKVVAWWGIDYVLLAKKGDTWLIEEVLWQGPLNTVDR